MRYHYEKPTRHLPRFDQTYFCDHQVYNQCTLFVIGRKGLAIIQQRYDESTKNTWWGEVDPWLASEIYLNPKFKGFFDERSSECTDGLYPTVTVRQIMWALKMKPLIKQRWETCFDRRDV